MFPINFFQIFFYKKGIYCLKFFHNIRNQERPMKRREFMQTSTMLTAAAALLPASLLNTQAIAANAQKFPAPLKPTMNGDVK